METVTDVPHEEEINPILGIQEILQLKPEELTDFLASRVIYDADDLIAIDKPISIPYSGGKKNRLQVDRVLQDLKKKIAPDTDRLHLVESLDRCASGVLLFAKTAQRQKEAKEALSEGRIQHRFRCIVKSIPENPTADITIPMGKVLKDKDVSFQPATSDTKDVFHWKTRYKLVNSNERMKVSLLDIFLTTSNVHQVRSHLAYGIGCPLIGESKYNLLKRNVPLKLSSQVLSCLGLNETSSRKVPMFIHLSEILIPIGSGSRFSVVKANYSPVFLHAVKMLRLLRR